MSPRRLLVFSVLVLAMACTTSDPVEPGVATPTAGAGGQARGAAIPDRPVAARTATGTRRPSWLGQRTLPVRSDGFGQVLPTPDELRDRRLPPPEHPIAPLVGDGFRSEITPVPDDVIDRSTWTPNCPVSRDQLRYVRLTFWGFDHRTHTGELLVNAAAAPALVDVFERLYEVRFPIEEMHIVARHELDLPPTGDGNNTTAFVCRPTRGSTGWSQHAFGLAVDVNPFHNPYVKGDLVLPELASAYTDRGWERPGMIRDGGPVVRAFAEIGWQWGGDWTRPSDPMHFSANGR